MNTPTSGTPLEKAIFSKAGEYWTLGYAGKIFRLKDTKGLAYIAHLLAHPATEFHALELARGGAARTESGEEEVATLSDIHELEQAGIHAGHLGDAGELLDDQAKATYRRRLAELGEERAEASRLGQIERAEEAEREMEALVAELSRATGLGGRNRVAVSASERARQSVTRRIKGALSRIADHHLPLGQMLAPCIRTGTYCSYNPGPNSTVSWEFESSSRSEDSSSAQAETPANVSDKQTTAVLGASAVPWPSSLSRTEFVGRNHEVRLLRSVLDRAAAGTGAVAIIGGGAGVGKTRLAMEMARDATERGFRAFVGRCIERDERFPYLPFAEILELMMAQSSSREDFRREIGDATGLVQVAPRLQQVFDGPPAVVELPTEMRRRWIYQSLSDFLSRVALRSPMLLVLDDLHWADEATLGLLGFLANQCGQIPLVLLGTYRDTELDSNPALLRTLDELIHDGLRPIKLPGLSQGDVAEMLRSLSMREPPLVLVQVAFEETQGNPFFVEEVFKHLVEEGKIFDANGQFQAGLTLDENDVPEHIRLVLQRRLQRLSETARQVLSAAAVVGRSFNFEILQLLLSSFEVGDLLAAIEQAHHMGLVVSSKGSESGLNFAHELVRQTLLIDVSKPRRQRLHLAVAEAIEHLDAGRLNEQAAVLAYHLRNAGRLADAAKTAGYFRLAGRNALEGAAYEEARFSLRSALSHLDAADLKARADVLSSLAVAQRALGDWDDALRMCNETVEIYRQLGDVAMTTDCIREGIAGLLMTRRYQEAAEMARRRLAELGDEPSESRADFLALLGLSYAMLGSYVPAKDALNEATALARRLSNPKLLVRVLANLCMVNTIFLEMADSLINTQTTLDLAQSDDFLWIRAGALYGQSQALYSLGRIEEADRITSELEPLARKIGQSAVVAACISRKAWAEFGKNPDLVRLEARLDESVEICRTARIPENLAYSLTQLSLVKFFRGQQSSALDCALKASELDLRGPGYTQGFAVGTVFRERAYAGDHAGAMAVFNENLSKLPRADQPNSFGPWAFLVSVVEGLTMLGERDQAADFYPLVSRLLDTGIISLSVMARFSRTIAGIAATAARQWQSAEEHFSIALRQAEEIPDQLERAECRRFYGSMLLDRDSAGDHVEAGRLLRDALADYSRIGMPLHIELTKALLGKI